MILICRWRQKISISHGGGAHVQRAVQRIRHLRVAAVWMMVVVVRIPVGCGKWVGIRMHRVSGSDLALAIARVEIAQRRMVRRRKRMQRMRRRRMRLMRTVRCRCVDRVVILSGRGSAGRKRGYWRQSSGRGGRGGSGGGGMARGGWCGNAKQVRR